MKPNLSVRDPTGGHLVPAPKPALLDGEPDVIASAKTDRRGTYRITGLPNCDFDINALPRGAEEAPTEVVRSSRGKWSSEDSVQVKPGGAVCDIRVKRGK